MANSRLSKYHNKCFVLLTKHAKSVAVNAAFEEVLNATVMEHVINTDQFGTFVGDCPRAKSHLETVKDKCRIAIERLKAPLVLASEGSFGPHPQMGFIGQGIESLHFVDSENNFELTVSDSTTDINYHQKLISSVGECLQFAKKVGFPQQGVILVGRQGDNLLVKKDFWSEHELALTMQDLTNYTVTIETDMRAHRNPMRMQHIFKVALKLAHRLNDLCPQCEAPGWGMIDVQKGLPCEHCGAKTPLASHTILGCTKCDFERKEPIKITHNSTEFCQSCNP